MSDLAWLALDADFEVLDAREHRSPPPPAPGHGGPRRGTIKEAAASPGTASPARQERKS